MFSKIGFLNQNQNLPSLIVFLYSKTNTELLDMASITKTAFSFRWYIKYKVKNMKIKRTSSPGRVCSYLIILRNFSLSKIYVFAARFILKSRCSNWHKDKNSSSFNWHTVSWQNIFSLFYSKDQQRRDNYKND